MDFGAILGKLGFDWRVFLFNIINILIMLFLLRKFVIVPILQMIDERKKLIEEGFNQEQEARKMLEEANLEAKKIVSNAINESEEIVQNAKSQSKKVAEEILNEANGKADQILESAEKSIDAKEKSMMEKARERLADMVTVATAKVVKS